MPDARCWTAWMLMLVVLGSNKLNGWRGRWYGLDAAECCAGWQSLAPKNGDVEL